MKGSEFLGLEYENVYLNWVRNVGILLVSAIALLVFSETHTIGVIIFIIGIFLLITLQVDYFYQREHFKEKNMQIPLRLDLLWVGTTLFIAVIFWLSISSKTLTNIQIHNC